MSDIEYEKIVKNTIKKESSIKNVLIAGLSGGLICTLGEILTNLYMKWFSVSLSDSYSLVFITFIILGSILTGIGVFDKVLSFCKCGLIVPSTGFANAMSSSAIDYKHEGFVKGIGANIFKLTGSIILYGIVFGIIFGFIKGVVM